VAASLRLQLGHPGGQGVDQIEQSDDQGVQRGVLGSLVLGSTRAARASSSSIIASAFYITARATWWICARSARNPSETLGKDLNSYPKATVDGRIL
jgi:hypothetical protein